MSNFLGGLVLGLLFGAIGVLVLLYQHKKFRSLAKQQVEEARKAAEEKLRREVLEIGKKLRKEA